MRYSLKQRERESRARAVPDTKLEVYQITSAGFHTGEGRGGRGPPNPPSTITVQ